MPPSLVDHQAAIRQALLGQHAAALPAAFGGSGPGPGVYRANVQNSLRDALAALYPVVTRLVGRDCFDATATVFLRDHPPCSPVLSHYGGAFPDFLATFPPLRDLIYLRDVARLELARRDIYHGPEAETLDSAVLAGLPQDRLPEVRLALHPANRLLDSPYPVLDIWAANQESEATPDRIQLERGGCRVLVIRPVARVDMHVLTAGGFVFTEALETGATLGEAFRRAEARDAAFDVFETLAMLANGRCFTAIQGKGPLP